MDHYKDTRQYDKTIQDNKNNIPIFHDDGQDKEKSTTGISGIGARLCMNGTRMKGTRL